MCKNLSYASSNIGCPNQPLRARCETMSFTATEVLLPYKKNQKTLTFSAKSKKLHNQADQMFAEWEAAEGEKWKVLDKSKVWQMNYNSSGLLEVTLSVTIEERKRRQHFIVGTADKINPSDAHRVCDFIGVEGVRNVWNSFAIANAFNLLALEIEAYPSKKIRFEYLEPFKSDSNEGDKVAIKLVYSFLD